MNSSVKKKAGSGASSGDSIIESQIFRSALDNLFEGCAIFGYNWHYLYANEVLATQAHSTREQLLGRSLLEVFPGIEATPFFKAFVITMEERIPQDIEASFTFADGITQWYEARSIAIPEGILVQVIDITRRKGAEQELIESNIRYSSLFNAKTNGIAHCKVIIDEKGIPVDYLILQVNDAYVNITGIPKNKIEGKTATEVFPGIENYAFDYIKNYGKVSLEGTELNFETYFEPLKLWLSIYAYSPQQGEFTAIFSDITERKQQEEIAVKNEARLSGILSSLAEGVIFIDKEGNIADYNETAIQMLQDAGETVQPGMTFNFIDVEGKTIPFEEHPGCFALRSKKPVRNIQLGIPQRDGSIMWLMVNGQPVYDKTGNVIGAVTSFSDINDIKEAEVALKANEAILDAYFNATPGMLNLIDDEFRFIKSDNITPTFFNLDRESIIGKSIKDLDPLLIENFLASMMEQVKSGSTVTNMEFSGPMPERNNEIAFWSVSYFPVPMPGGKIAMGTMAVEITELKKAEKALTESEERFRTLADNISQLAWMADNTGFVFWYNKRWYDYTGSDFEDVKGSGWRNVCHPDFVPEVYDKFSECVQSGEPWEDLFPIKNKNNEYRWFLTRAQPVYNSDNIIVRWFVTNTDITGQIELENTLKKTLMKLKENEIQLLDAQKLAHIGSVEVYADINKAKWSEEVYNIFEWDRKFGVPDSETVFNFIHPEDRIRVSQGVEEGVKNKKTIQIEFRIITPSGKTKYVNYIARPVFDESGRHTKRLGALIDITESKLDELRLQEAYDIIQEKFSEKEVLLRELYHRTKNNMQVISSLLGLKSSTIDDDRIKDIFQEMQNRIRAIAMVHEKLYQSRNLSKINLAEYIQELSQLIFESSTESNSNIKLQHSLESINVLIDIAVPCGLIITELLLNSLKHAFTDRDSGIIKIILKKLVGKKIHLTVSDNGKGMSPEDQHKENKLGLQIFENIARDQLEATVNLDTSEGVA